MDINERNFILADKKYLKEMLDHIPEEAVIDRLSVMSKIEKDEEKLREENTKMVEETKGQLEILGDYIMREIPGEPSVNMGAGDTAIRIMDNYREAFEKIIRLIDTFEVERIRQENMELLYDIKDVADSALNNYPSRV